MKASIRQTISLFRYQLSGILGWQLVFLVLVILLAGFLLSGFIGQLSLLDSAQNSVAVMADFYRYALIFLSLLVISQNIAQDFAFNLFDRILAMPFSRWQYLFAQVMLIKLLNLMLVLPMMLLLIFVTDPTTVFYWAMAVWLELMLVGLIALLMSVSLEKLPISVISSLGLFLLIKFSGLISLMLAESVRLNDAGTLSVFFQSVFQAVSALLPSLTIFADNNVFFDQSGWLSLLSGQLVQLIVFGGLLLVVAHIEFYRKEFSG